MLYLSMAYSLQSSTIQHALTATGLQITDGLIRCAQSNAGTIDYEEFIAATINLNRLEQEAAYQQAFQHFDTDNSGCLSADEIKEALKVNMTCCQQIRPKVLLYEDSIQPMNSAVSP